MGSKIFFKIMQKLIIYAKKTIKLFVPLRVRNYINSVLLMRWLRLWYKVNFILRPTLKKQLDQSGMEVSQSSNATRVFIPLLQTNHYQFYQILILAESLRIRGADVKVLICDSVMEGCELKNINNISSNPCLNCAYNAKNLLPLYNLEFVKLSELLSVSDISNLNDISEQISLNFTDTYEYKGVEIIQMVNDSVTRHCYGDVPEQDQKHLGLLRKMYSFTALVGVEVAERIHLEWKPDIILNDMNVYCDWAPYSMYFKKQGIKYNTISMSPFDYDKIYVNYEELYSGPKRFDNWVSNRAQATLDEEEQKINNRVVEKRLRDGGDFEEHCGFFKDGESVDSLSIDKSKRNIFIFSNLFWDIGLNYRDTLYPDVISWVLETVEILRKHLDCHLYIKIHPSEVFDYRSLKGVSSFVMDKYPKLPENVSIIYPEQKINTYDLFHFIDLGVVYNSTLGLEMLLDGIPVIATGAAPYTGHDLVNEPGTVEEYADLLIGKMDCFIPKPDLVNLFSHFYFTKSQLPWKLTERVYADDFKGYKINSLRDLIPDQDKRLDHLCNYILKPDKLVFEAWN
jgi:hypothetical protein